MPKDTKTKNPRFAASIILMRDGTDQIEILMLTRHKEIDFASGALVFPGGKIDEQDIDRSLIAYLDGAASTDEQRATQVAAIRETFEECGILLARSQKTARLVSGDRARELSYYRKALHEGEVSVEQFLAKEQLRLAGDLLTHFANWITPEFVHRRFDTHFFLAAVPDDQVAEHDRSESVDAAWIKPKDAISDAEKGIRTVLFPTICNLDKVGRYRSPEQAIETARASKVQAVSPWLETRKDGKYLRIAEDAGYTVTESKIS